MKRLSHRKLAIIDQFRKDGKIVVEITGRGSEYKVFGYYLNGHSFVEKLSRSDATKMLEGTFQK